MHPLWRMSALLVLISYNEDFSYLKKNGVNEVLSNWFGMPGVLETWINTGRAVRSHFRLFLTDLSPSASVVQESAATLFCSEAPEMFYGIQNFTSLSRLQLDLNLGG